MLCIVAPDANFPGKLEGVVLCGGNSSRMGRDKAFLIVENEPLWLRQWSRLRAIVGHEPLVSVRSGAAISSSGTGPDGRVGAENLRYVYDDGASGPLGGILAAFDAIADATHLAVLAVDLPFVEVAWWEGLKRSCVATRGAVGRRSGDDESWEPVAAIYPRSMLAAMRRAKEEGRLSLQRLVASAVAEGQLTEVAITSEQARFFRNWNTPEDVGCF